MDDTNIKILSVLKENARVSASEISRQINLSVPAVAERIRKMEDSGVIEKYTVKINRESTHYAMLVFVLVNIDKTENIEGFRSEIVKNSEVLECHHIAGEYDYILKIVTHNTKDLERFLSMKLKAIKGVIKSNTIITLASIKEEINV